MLISKERRKRGRRGGSDGHGINICNRCAVGDCGPVGPVERLGSYWTHVFVNQARRKYKVDRLHGRITMVNGKQHEEPLLIFLGTSLHRAKCVFATECVKTAGHSQNAPLSSATLALCPDSCRTPRCSRPDHCGPGPIDKYRM